MLLEGKTKLFPITKTAVFHCKNTHTIDRKCFSIKDVGIKTVDRCMFLSPRFFKKSEGDIVIIFVRLSVRLSVMLSPKLLDEIQPNLVCE